MKAGGLVLETRWFCLLLEVSDCCEGSVFGKMAPAGLLMFDWEESSEAGLRRG